MTAYRALGRHGLVVVAALIAGTAAHAEERVIALSPAEKAELLDELAARPAKVDAGEPAINGRGREVHGEVGMFVGTGGARGLFGSAVAPVGENGSIAVAFENSRYGRFR